MDINSGHQTSYPTQYQEAFDKYVDNEYCAKDRYVPINQLQCLPSSNSISSAMVSGSCQSSFDPHDFSSDDEEYYIANNVAKTTPRWNGHPALCEPATRLHLHSPPEAPMYRGQIHQNLNECHSDPMEFRGTLGIPNMTDWWRQQEQTQSKYTNLSNIECNIFSTIPHHVGVEAGFSLGRNVIGYMQSNTTVQTFRKEVVLRQFSQANKEILAKTDAELNPMNPENNSEMKKEAEKRKLHRMANVHDFWEMWQGNQDLHATKKESRTQNKQITEVRYIFDTKEIIQSILFTYSTCRCSYIQIVREISFATATFVCKGPRWRTNSNHKCPPNHNNQPSASRKWQT